MKELIVQYEHPLIIKWLLDATKKPKITHVVTKYEIDNHNQKLPKG